MGVHKVPQDVEAEDKLLGPLTFKQFIFMLIAAGSTMLGWLLFSIHPALGILALPFVLIFGGLAVFRREDQPVERYLLSFFNFMLRPRTRVWSTEGFYDHLVITAPKRKAGPKLKQDIGQVHGQLEKLAQIVDTRGWAAKRPDLQLPGQAAVITGDERLFVPDQQLSEVEVQESDDIMDNSNPEAAKLDELIRDTAEQNKQKVIEQMNSQPRPPALSDESNANQDDRSADRQSSTQDRGQAAGKKNHGTKKPARKHNPEKTKTPSSDAHNQTPEPAAQSANPDILELSGELKVSQMAAALNRHSQNDELKKGEEIRLR